MIKPWEHKSYSDIYMGHCWGRKSTKPHKRTYETVKDSARLYLRKGDIVRFGSGYYEHFLTGWPEWFLVGREDKKKYWQRDATPFYAQNQYAIVVNRYKWIKHKYLKFTDYGVIIMMITGPQIGRIRKFYTNKPFKIKSCYPYNKIKGRYIKLKKPFKTIKDNLFLPGFNITSFINKLEKKFGDTEEARDLFLEKICLLLEVKI